MKAENGEKIVENYLEILKEYQKHIKSNVNASVEASYFEVIGISDLKFNKKGLLVTLIRHNVENDMYQDYEFFIKYS